MICEGEQWAVAYLGADGRWYAFPQFIGDTRSAAIQAYDDAYWEGDYARDRRRGEVRSVKVTMTFEVPE